MTDKNLYSGLIRLHILNRSAEAPIFGLAIIKELRHHGYEQSEGTLYPMLHGLEKRGYLRSHHERTGATSDACKRILMKAEPRWQMPSSGLGSFFWGGLSTHTEGAYSQGSGPTPYLDEQAHFGKHDSICKMWTRCAYSLKPAARQVLHGFCPTPTSQIINDLAQRVHFH